MKYEVPRHNKLDEIGKDDGLIDALVKDNIPRTASWTLGSLALAYMIFKGF